jgi:hypothetical protein
MVKVTPEEKKMRPVEVLWTSRIRQGRRERKRLLHRTCGLYIILLSARRSDNAWDGMVNHYFELRRGAVI